MHQSHLRAAILIVQTLKAAGHHALFAGGWVRDYLLKHPSDDIDIATEASPDEVIALFPHTVPVGKSFGVVIVIVDDKPFEVSSFRKDGLYLYGRRPEHVEPATPFEDAQRRDFTVNGMFYDPVEEKIYDYVDGRKDLQKRLIRAIGNPHERFREDRLRMVRAVRLSARLNFTLDAETERAIADHASTLFPAVATERVWQELEKIAAYPGIERAIRMLHSLHLLQEILPPLKSLSLAAVHRITSHFPRFPATCPVILYLAQLFAHQTAEELVAYFEEYKIPNRDKELLQNYLRSIDLIAEKRALTRSEWVDFYALPTAFLFVEIEAAKRSEAEGDLLIATHRVRYLELAASVARKRSRSPLVRASHLRAFGISDGPLMGKWLKEAEEIAIENNLKTPEEVLPLLMAQIERERQ